MTVISTPEGIARYRLASAFAVCKLTLIGIKGRFDKQAWEVLATHYGVKYPTSKKQKVALYRTAHADFPTFLPVEEKYLGGY